MPTLNEANLTVEISGIDSVIEKTNQLKSLLQEVKELAVSLNSGITASNVHSKDSVNEIQITLSRTNWENVSAILNGKLPYCNSDTLAAIKEKIRAACHQKY